ncbi:MULTISPECIES: zinc-ribbon domain-containing protein [Clostridium]|uniref:Zinc-ribbon domain-containing protein n=1 Tax=Clostridium cibarium TaxID=2762247 RepID=A0ABR8PRE4_9CLOT|nr:MULTISPECIES: zinc-ribbon domain-containing protein [Clostridium]MBD7910732.1 zinc-ribbon domain-containing protein [Clostridium cibarium]
MLIWGWGRVTKRSIGPVFQQTCSYCNTTSIWKLYVIRTWFTLFFIPIIPYSKRYCVACPSCGSYIKLNKQQFQEMKLAIDTATNSRNIEDNLKYQGKTETQISYLKEMEKLNDKKDREC